MPLQGQNLKHPAAGWLVNSTKNLVALESVELASDHECMKNLAAPLGSRLQLTKAFGHQAASKIRKSRQVPELIRWAPKNSKASSCPDYLAIRTTHQPEQYICALLMQI